MKEENSSVDEQVVLFKGRSYLKAEAVCGNITPQKPHKLGYKVWVLCGVSGYAYDFEVHTGGQNNLLMNDKEDCGASGNSKFTDDIVSPRGPWTRVDQEENYCNS